MHHRHTLAKWNLHPLTHNRLALVMQTLHQLTHNVYILFIWNVHSLRIHWRLSTILKTSIKLYEVCFWYVKVSTLSVKKKCRTKLMKFFRGDENFVRRKCCPKIKFYILACFDRLSTLQIWNIHIGLPSNVKP